MGQGDVLCICGAHGDVLYVETLGTEHMAANRRVTEQKKAICLAEVGPEVYSVLSNLLSLAKP